MLETCILAHRGASRDDPEGGAGGGRPAGGRLVTARLGRPGKSQARPTTRRFFISFFFPSSSPRSSLHGIRVMLGARKRGPEAKTAKVERRGQSVRVMGLKAPRGRLAAASCETKGVRRDPNVSRRSPTPRLGVSEGTRAKTTEAEMRRGNEMGCLKSE